MQKGNCYGEQATSESSFKREIDFKYLILNFGLTIHSGILGFINLIPTENENILLFEKSKWIRKQKLTSNISFFLEFFSQLILTTGIQNRSPDIIVYYGIWACVPTKRAVALFSDVIHTS